MNGLTRLISIPVMAVLITRTITIMHSDNSNLARHICRSSFYRLYNPRFVNDTYRHYPKQQYISIKAAPMSAAFILKSKSNIY